MHLIRQYTYLGPLQDKFAVDLRLLGPETLCHYSEGSISHLFVVETQTAVKHKLSLPCHVVLRCVTLCYIMLSWIKL